MYGFELVALGPRTVDATITFDTDAGWFKILVPPITLTERDRHYNGPSNGFVDPEWVSPATYVRFPKPVRVNHAWISSALSVGDSFGWSAQGPVDCSPDPNGDVRAGLRGDDYIKLYEEDRLNAQPARESVVIDAQQAVAVPHPECAHPFSDATVTHEVGPTYTGILAAEGAGGDTGIIVAIGADGLLKDAWVWAPSGQKQFDDATLTAAKKSTYKAGTAYCKPVPGIYLFWATFGD
ncbi:MAG TPA: energy transducer TonB [Candidatus Rubrimentiphilum sp.]|nr:energy transducer TonB [Candidatus Rubrimentiphilum sp.]